MAARDHAYWNHNAVYHPWLLAIAAEHRGDVLDVGCGDGLLAQRLKAGIAIADRRTALRHVTVSQAEFEGYQADELRFDLQGAGLVDSDGRDSGGRLCRQQDCARLGLVGEVLPDASVRRALYYRYLLR